MPSRDERRGIGLALAVTVALNALYFIIVLVGASASSAPVIANVELSFAKHELDDQDYLKDDWRRGLNQYNDCMVVQLAINPRPTNIEKALAPVAYTSDSSYSDVCATLKRLLDPATDRAALYADRYARYWHGYIPVAALLLTTGDIGLARILLRTFVVAAILILLLAAIRTRGPLRTFGISVAVTAAMFWALPYYGQGLSYAPGDGVLMLGLAAVLFTRHRLREGGTLIPFAAAYASVIAFFEMLTGQLPTAACLLFVAAYLLGPGDEPARVKWRRASAALLAFGLGAVLTVVIKQLLALAILGPDVINPFLTNLGHYTGLSNYAGSLLSPFAHLLFATHILTYRSIAGGVSLLGCALAAWLVAGFLALRSGADAARRSLFLAHLVGACGVVTWILLLPVHTSEHAAFMVRIGIVPIALGFSALLGSVRLSQRNQLPAD